MTTRSGQSFRKSLTAQRGVTGEREAMSDDNEREETEPDRAQAETGQTRVSSASTVIAMDTCP